MSDNDLKKSETDGHESDIGNSYNRSSELYQESDEKKEYQFDSLSRNAGQGRNTGYSHSGRKGSTGKGIVIGMLIILIPLILFISAGAVLLNRMGSKLVLTSDGGVDMAVVSAKLNAIQTLVDQLFLFDYEKEELENGIYEGYVNALGDPYTCYYTKDAYQDMMEGSQGSYYGIGVMISQEAESQRVLVIRVFSGSPAEEAGVKAGDYIMEVEGHEVTGMDLNEVVTYIKGAEGTTAEIRIRRNEEPDLLKFDVERRQVDVDTVYSRMLDEEIGYLELTEFDSVSTEQFQKAIQNLQEQGMKELVLDLRDNPGGLLDVAVDIADMLIDTGTVVTISDKNGEAQEYEAVNAGALNVPLTVLVNGNSASASEVLSGCLKDYGAATLVGTQTFGKGIVQTIYPFADGTAMKLTTAHYYTPEGTDIHGTGITPDVVIEDDPETDDVDEQLEKAVEILKTK